MGGPDRSEVALVECRNLRFDQALRECNDAGIDHSEREIRVAGLQLAAAGKIAAGKGGRVCFREGLGQVKIQEFITRDR